MSPLVTLGTSQLKVREGGTVGFVLATLSSILGGSGAVKSALATHYN